MVARGIIAPEESTTVPLMSPEAPTPCAKSLWDTSADSSAHARKAFRFMAPPDYLNRFGRRASSESEPPASGNQPLPLFNTRRYAFPPLTVTEHAQQCDSVFGIVITTFFCNSRRRSDLWR